MPEHPRKDLTEINRYIAGSAHVAGVGHVVKLSSNENPLGPPPCVMDSIRDFCSTPDKVLKYPDMNYSDLRKAIADKYNLDPQRITCGSGSDQVLHMAALAHLNQGDEVIYSQHAFLMYRIITLAHGCIPVPIQEEHDFTDSVSRIIESITDRTRMIFIANPNNPTGTFLPRLELIRLIKSLPPCVMLVIDSAYAEYAYADDGEYCDGVELIEEFPHSSIIMTRTFSKAYGMAGLRLGWGYASNKIIQLIEKIREPFNISSVAVCAGIAALSDKIHINTCIQHNTLQRSLLTEMLRNDGITVFPSRANFIMLQIPSAYDQTAEWTAQAAFDFMCTSGFIVRKLDSYKLEKYLRITIGTADDCKSIRQILLDFMAFNRCL